MTLLFLFCSTIFLAQNNFEENELIFENLKLEITIDSKDDIKDINLSDIKSIFNQSKENQPIDLNIHCNNITSIGTELVTNLSFNIKGNSNDISLLIKKIKTIKKNIKKYYNNQKMNK